MKNFKTIVAIARHIQEDLRAKMQIDRIEEAIIGNTWLHENDAIQHFYKKCDELGLHYNDWIGAHDTLD